MELVEGGPIVFAEAANFRSLHYGYADPNATIVLWWSMFADTRLHVRGELRMQFETIENICEAVKKRTRELLIDPATIGYTVADQENIGDEDTDGESRAETFAKCGVPLRVIEPDPVQGWTRVRELLGVRPDGRPWLTIHPDCAYLIKALASATQHQHDPEDVREFGNIQPLFALRVGAMSRPAPKWLQKPPPPKNSVGHLVEELRRAATANATTAIEQHRWRSPR